jgi:TonB family protein
MGADRRRFGGALGASAAAHGILAVLLLLFGIPSTPGATHANPGEFKSIYYIASAGPSGGGGGSAAPPSHASRTATTAARVTPVAVTAKPTDVPATALDAPVSSDPSKMLELVGTDVGRFSKPGGPGRGSGDGPGRGPGVGPGEGGHRGGGPRQVGNGVGSPVPLVQVKPQYTSEAMRARVQGSVTLEVIVKADGTVGDVRVVKSLDRALGLDAAAVRAAKQWTFRPATFEGKPVDVLVLIVLDFRIQ